MKVCHACGQEIVVLAGRTVGRSETCVKCRADLRCCLNCRFYDPVSANECREPQADRVMQKERGNFCDFFVFRDRSGPVREGAAHAGAKEKLEDLFKK